MNKFCEIRLINIGESNSGKRKNNHTKYSTNYKTLTAKNHKSTKKSTSETGNVIVLSKNDASTLKEVKKANCNVPGNVTKRQSKFLTKTVLKQDCINTDMACKQTKMGLCLENSLKSKNDAQYKNNIERKALKRKSSPERSEDIVPLLKRLHTIKIGTFSTPNDSVTSNKDFNQEKKKKTRKRKSHKIYWENKLTGARRVSKRLTNLKMKTKASERIQTCTNIHHAFIEDKRIIPIISNVEKKIKSMKLQHNKCRKDKEVKVKKSVLKTNKTKQPTNNFKHGYTKKLFPITAPNKRIPTSYRVTVKPGGKFSSNDLSNAKKTANVFKEIAIPGYESSSETNEKVDNTITYSVLKSGSEELYPAVEETLQGLELDSNTKNILNSIDSADNQCNELNNLQSIDIPDEISEQTIICDVQCIGNSQVMNVDIEFGENVTHEHSEECHRTSIISAGSEKCSQINQEKELNSEPVGSIVKSLNISSESSMEKNDNPLLRTDEDISTTAERPDVLDDIFVQDSTGLKEVQVTNSELSVDKINVTD